MKLTTAELAEVRAILEKIDQGLIQPHVPDRIGRFLRQYSGGRAQLDEILGRRGLARRADAAVTGRSLGTVEFYPILPPEVSLLGLPLGEVAATLAVSEELGGLVDAVMWLKGPVANAAYNLLRASPGLRLSGDYRWTPPNRITPGEALLEASDSGITWQNARCLKAVADDLLRPPHALEYIPDYRLGAPGLKHFRSVCAAKAGGGWLVLPALTQPTNLELAAATTDVVSALNSAALLMLLIYREPWSPAWTVVAATAIDARDALAHSVTWADFRRELEGSQVDGSVVRAIRESLRASGLRPGDSLDVNLRRSLLPLARDVLCWLRGSG